MCNRLIGPPPPTFSAYRKHFKLPFALFSPSTESPSPRAKPACFCLDESSAHLSRNFDHPDKGRENLKKENP